MKNIFYVVASLAIFAQVSCQKDSNQKVDLVKYKSLGQSILLDMNTIGDQIRQSKETFSKPEVVLEEARKYYCEESEEFISFQESFNLAISKRSIRCNSLTSEQNQDLDDIQVNLNGSSSAQEFLLFLNSKFDEVLTSDWSLADKDFLLTYITSYISGVEFMTNNLDILSPNNHNIRGWWASWGRCAAGIIGGAGLGALGGGAAGSVIPIVGTVGGMITGGISGGLSGASAAC
jgi:hypothetical protein